MTFPEFVVLMEGETLDIFRESARREPAGNDVLSNPLLFCYRDGDATSSYQNLPNEALQSTKTKQQLGSVIRAGLHGTGVRHTCMLVESWLVVRSKTEMDIVGFPRVSQQPDRVEVLLLHYSSATAEGRLHEQFSAFRIARDVTGRITDLVNFPMPKAEPEDEEVATGSPIEIYSVFGPLVDTALLYSQPA